jgi:hypothetical protein
MRARTTAFDGLIEALNERSVKDPDWPSIIGLANHTLLTPALFEALARTGQIEDLPEDAREYLRFLRESNRERNARLRAQLFEAVAELNRHGIVPVLLKGAVPLFLSAASDLPSRITSDLDLAVDMAELSAAEGFLEGIGYVAADDFRGMARPQDVGLLELRPKRDDARSAVPGLVEREGARVLIPPSISRAAHWIMHDLVKEGDYVRGRLDLRHLHDLARLSVEDGVDWSALRASAPDRMSRNAVDAQLLALEDLFGIRMPAAGARGRAIRFHHWRRVFSARHPIAGAPLRVGGNLVWGASRLRNLPALARLGAFEAARRIARTAFQIRPRSKL